MKKNPAFFFEKGGEVAFEQNVNIFFKLFTYKALNNVFGVVFMGYTA